MLKKLCINSDIIGKHINYANWCTLYGALILSTALVNGGCSGAVEYKLCRKYGWDIKDTLNATIVEYYIGFCSGITYGFCMPALIMVGVIVYVDDHFITTDKKQTNSFSSLITRIK